MGGYGRLTPVKLTGADVAREVVGSIAGTVNLALIVRTLSIERSSKLPENQGFPVSGISLSARDFTQVDNALGE